MSGIEENMGIQGMLTYVCHSWFGENENSEQVLVTQKQVTVVYSPVPTPTRCPEGNTVCFLLGIYRLPFSCCSGKRGLNFAFKPVSWQHVLDKQGVSSVVNNVSWRIVLANVNGVLGTTLHSAAHSGRGCPYNLSEMT